jgi:hypothetical protein
MQQAYLKCKCYESPTFPVTFSDECLVTFKCLNPYNDQLELEGLVFPPEGEEWRIVNRKDVVTLDENKGLVRLVNLERYEDKKEAGVQIKDVTDCRIYGYRVPLEEVEVR